MNLPYVTEDSLTEFICVCDKRTTVLERILIVEVHVGTSCTIETHVQQDHMFGNSVAKAQ